MLQCFNWWCTSFSTSACFRRILISQTLLLMLMVSELWMSEISWTFMQMQSVFWFILIKFISLSRLKHCEFVQVISENMERNETHRPEFWWDKSHIIFPSFTLLMFIEMNFHFHSSQCMNLKLCVSIFSIETFVNQISQSSLKLIIVVMRFIVGTRVSSASIFITQLNTGKSEFDLKAIGLLSAKQ